MADESHEFQIGDRVHFDGFAHPFKGQVIRRGLGLGLELENVYYVRSHEGEVRMYEGKALQRL